MEAAEEVMGEVSFGEKGLKVALLHLVLSLFFVVVSRVFMMF